jgi:hypothetical protein
MHTAPAVSPSSHGAPALKRLGAPPGRGKAVLAALACTVRRVWPSRRSAQQAHAGASDDSDETAMHSPCL